MEWIRYFVGTPQRFVRTFFTVASVVVMFTPGLLGIIVGRLLTELSPLLEPLLTIVVVCMGIRIILFGRRK